MKRLLMILALAAIGPAQAEVLIVPSAPAPHAAESGETVPPPSLDRSHLPTRGLDMDAVRKRYGEPNCG